MPKSAMPSHRGQACERRRKLGTRLPRVARALVVASAAIVLLGAPALAVQPAAPNPVERGVSAESGPEQSATRAVVDMIARLVNFGILAGTLYYLLRSPIAKYLGNRHAQIRRDLVDAAEMKQDAAAQIAAIDRRLQALPAELEALRTQGTREIAAEEARIRAAADVERDRLLEQARREIDLQAKVAERELVAHAADLAVGVATERIKATITDADQQRLVDRYVTQLKG